MSARSRSRTLLAWALWTATVVSCAGGLLAVLLWVRPLTLGVLGYGAATALIFPLGYATIGLVVTLRRPENPIGWLHASSGLVWALVIPWQPLLTHLIRRGGDLSLAAQLAVIGGETIWAPAIALGMTVPFLLLPDGRLRSRRWRAVLGLVVTGVVLFVVAGTLTPGTTTTTPVPLDNPFGLSGRAGEIAGAVTLIGLGFYAVSLVGALLCVLLRFRAARGAERQQLRWVATGAAIAVVVLLPLPGVGQLPAFMTGLAVLCVPASVAVAVLRYRLWDLDRLISRTVAYTLITALLALPYLLILPVTTYVAGQAGSLAVALATLAATAVFRMVRRPVQDLVDRRFDRRRYHAGRTRDAFAAWLRGQVDVDVVSAGLASTVQATFAPASTSVWLRSGADRWPAGPARAPRPGRGSA